MNRRDFIALSAATLVAAPAIADTKAYTPGMVDKALARGETVFVGFSADWCGTCKRQERIMDALRSDNPDYDAKMTFIRVDWDDYKNDPITSFYNVPRRSTLIVLKGDQELGRTVAGTGEAEIKALMDAGLAAAGS